VGFLEITALPHVHRQPAGLIELEGVERERGRDPLWMKKE